MKKNMFFSVIVLMFFSCTSKSSITNRQTYEDSIRNMIKEQFDKDSLVIVSKSVPEDSLFEIIKEQFQNDNVFIKYYEVSKNTKNIVRYGFGFMTIPDSIVYRKIFYKNGGLCGEGYSTFFDSRDGEGSCEVGKWKYCTPDGTRFEKYYKYTIGLQKDSI